MFDSSEKSELLSQASSFEAVGVKNLDDDDLDEADRIKATGFNIFRAARMSEMINHQNVKELTDRRTRSNQYFVRISKHPV